MLSEKSHHWFYLLNTIFCYKYLQQQKDRLCTSLVAPGVRFDPHTTHHKEHCDKEAHSYVIVLLLKEEERSRATHIKLSLIWSIWWNHLIVASMEVTGHQLFLNDIWEPLHRMVKMFRALSQIMIAKPKLCIPWCLKSSFIKDIKCWLMCLLILCQSLFCVTLPFDESWAIQKPCLMWYQC